MLRESMNEKILVKMYNKPYVIRFTKTNDELDTVFIYTRDKREVEIFLAILGANISLYEPDIKSQEIISWLSEKTYADILPTVKLTGKEHEEVLKCFDKIGIHPRVQERLQDAFFKTKLDNSFIHKSSASNVMLSQYVSFEDTDIICLNAFYETEEIKLDHIADDHVEAMLLTEISRQAGIAAAGVVQDPSKIFIILKEERLYKRFVKRDEPATIQVLCVAPKVAGYCVFSLIQEGVCCMKGCLVGRSFTNKEEYVR